MSRIKLAIVAAIVAVLLVSLSYIIFHSRLANSNSCLAKHNTRSIDQCLSNMALTHRDIEMCKTIQDTEMQFRCHAHIAIALERPDLCSLITDLRQLSCQDLVKLGLQGCYQLPEGIERRDMCLTVYAEITGNLSLCDELAVLELRNAWRDDCYTSIAVRNGDLRVCEEIAWDDYGKAKCYALLALLKEEYALCERAGDADLCYYYLAREAKDITICARVKSNEGRQSCESTATLHLMA